MKILKFILPLSLVICFTGCLDIDEKVEVKKDGSGKVAIDMDMSQMVELMQTYIGKEEMAKKGMDKMDTTILMKDVVDTLSNLSAEKKALLREGSVHVQLDVDAKIFKTHMQFPFTSLENLQKLYRTMNDGSLGSTQLFKGITPGDDATGGNNPDINQFNGVYDFTCKDGSLTKKLNMERWQALKDNPQMAQLKQAGQMGVEIKYTTAITLPRPIKKVDNPLAQLSEDKRTVLIKFNLIDIFDHPEQFGYAIEY